MTVFNEYARYYDLLYRDKDYAGEAAYVDGLIRSRVPGARRILNLGCGSGRHDRSLVQRGYEVTGVDISEEMLAAARAAAEGNTSLAYVKGDVRSVRLGQTFDAVISLFHVMSYQTANDDLIAALATANHHLEPEGIFIFDCWHGPGVLTDRPTARTKELEDDFIRVNRFAEPVMQANENVVDVKYRVSIANKGDGTVRELHEIHRMRYLFVPEVLLFLKITGFELVGAEVWLTGKGLGFDAWNAVFVCRKTATGVSS